jgi:hypothetical protein
MERSDLLLQQKLDNNGYRDSFLFEVKTALNLPYITGNGSYEPVEGTIQIGGKYYNYVKRKIHQDTLYILCVANPSKTAFAEASNRASEQLNDIAGLEKPSKSSVKKINFLSEYNQPIELLSDGVSSDNDTRHSFVSSSLLIHRDKDRNFRPPGFDFA